MPRWATPPTLPEAREVFDRASGENFSVASVVLGRTARRHLLAIYGYRAARRPDRRCRGRRPARAARGLRGRPRPDLRRRRPAHPVLRRLAPTVHELDAAARPFARLIDANRRDQEHGRLRDLRRPSRLLRPLCQSGRRARAPRLRRRHPRPRRALRPRLLGAATRRALAGRRRGSRRGPDLSAGRGSRPLRGRGDRTRRPGTGRPCAS